MSSTCFLALFFSQSGGPDPEETFRRGHNGSRSCSPTQAIGLPPSLPLRERYLHDHRTKLQGFIDACANPTFSGLQSTQGNGCQEVDRKLKGQSHWHHLEYNIQTQFDGSPSDPQPKSPTNLRSNPRLWGDSTSPPRGFCRRAIRVLTRFIRRSKSVRPTDRWSFFTCCSPDL